MNFLEIPKPVRRKYFMFMIVKSMQIIAPKGIPMARSRSARMI
jgi:hypothetical protein